MIETGVIFILIRDEKILMQQRDGNCKRFPFMWCIPGGGHNEGEGDIETLFREVREEYCIDLKENQYEFLMDFNSDQDKVFICRLDIDQIPKMNEGVDMKFMNIEEIDKIELGFNQKEIVVKLKEKFNK